MGRPKLDPEKVFLNNFTKGRNANNCWRWTKEIHGTTGYGRFRASNKAWHSHRFSYEFYKGEIPKGFHVHHICNNRWCVNPKHLHAISAGDHVIFGNTLTGENSRKTHCKHGHEFNEKNTYVYRRLKEGTLRRICRACGRINIKKSNHKS